MLAGDVDEKNGHPWYENGMFGFSRSLKPDFATLYWRTREYVVRRKENGYGAYIDFINDRLKRERGIDTRKVVHKIGFDGTVALHPEGNFDSDKKR